MAITAQETQARMALKAVIEKEFEAEKLEVKDDRLHASLGQEEAVIGIYPERTEATHGNRALQEMKLIVQFFNHWDKEVNPRQEVSPSHIENNAERFRRALKADSPGGTDLVWYFLVDRISYTPDPTGNITRFEALVLAYGNNPQLMETTG
jgi:hypothetical protein